MNADAQVSPGQAAAKRHIISFRAEQFEAHGEPYVRMVVLGQSFMLHQIRKMVRVPASPRPSRRMPGRVLSCQCL